MNRKLVSYLTLAIVLGFVSVTLAGYPKKRQPSSKRDVEKALEAAGGDHNPEKIKIKDIGYLKTGTEEPEETSWFWIYSGQLDDKSGYHLIIFDNTPKYLGYYLVTAEPRDTDGKEYINLYTDENVDENGVPLPKTVPFDESGPPKRIQDANGMPVKFVPAPPPAAPEKSTSGSSSSTSSASSSSSGPKMEPEYRSWHITIGEKVIEVESAIFVELKNGNVTIKDAKTGRTVTKPIAAFSDEDKEYLKQLLK